MCTMTTNEYGVSEVIGFILILGIVITGMGLVTLYGYPILLKEQQNANIKNMERNMIVLQNEVKGLAYKSVPYRETTMQITGGTLEVIRPNCPTCSVNNPNLPGQSYFSISKSGTYIFHSTSQIQVPQVSIPVFYCSKVPRLLQLSVYKMVPS